MTTARDKKRSKTKKNQTKTKANKIASCLGQSTRFTFTVKRAKEVLNDDDDTAGHSRKSSLIILIKLKPQRKVEQAGEQTADEKPDRRSAQTLGTMPKSFYFHLKRVSPTGASCLGSH